MDPPTFEELEEAIKKLKNNKAVGADGITAASKAEQNSKIERFD